MLPTCQGHGGTAASLHGSGAWIYVLPPSCEKQHAKYIHNTSSLGSFTHKCRHEWACTVWAVLLEAGELSNFRGCIRAKTDLLIAILRPCFMFFICSFTPILTAFGIDFVTCKEESGKDSVDFLSCMQLYAAQAIPIAAQDILYNVRWSFVLLGFDCFHTSLKAFVRC